MVSVKRTAVAFLFYVGGFSLPFLLENATELSEHLPEGFQQYAAKMGTSYQRWSAGPRGIESRYTAFVALNQKSLPSTITNSCRQRQVITTLLPRLAEQIPSAIVIDLAFTRDGCPADQYQNWTERLKSTIICVSSGIPIVLGHSARTVSEAPEEDRRRMIAAGVQGNGMFPRSLIDLPTSDSSTGSDIHVGLIRSNRDLRRVALEWPIYTTRGDSYEYSGMQPSLVLAAARISRKGFPDGSETIEEFVRAGEHPYTTLMPAEKFIRVDAADLLCGAGFEERACPEPDPDRRLREKLRGKIAIVAWEDDYLSDSYETVVGRLPGGLLNANYIESLLDGRLLHPVSLLWQIGLSLLWFMLVEWPFHVWKHEVERAFLAAIIMFIGVSFILYYVLVVNMGWYLALLPPSFAALVSRFWYQRFEEGRATPKKGRKRKAHHPPEVQHVNR